ncbi:MAG: dTMP kinase [Henriciella sp.]
MKRGTFITLEGGEGSGKSTLIGALAVELEKRGIQTLTTREPGGTPLAEAVRELALYPPHDQSWSPLAHALLMNTAREDHLRRKIAPALNQGYWVLCDRFADSTRAYQSIDGVEMSVLHGLETAVVGQSQPDLTLILDGAPQDLLKRREDRGVSDAFEDKELAFHHKVREAFLQIAQDEPDRCVVLNALSSQEQVLDAALEAIQTRFDLK